MFRAVQLAGGGYSYFENLLRGLVALKTGPDGHDDFTLTVFHGRADFRWRDPQVDFRRISDRWGRFAAETRIGAFDSRAFDAILFRNYFTPPIVRARRSVTVIHDLQFRHMPEFVPTIKWHWLNACHRFTLSKSDAVVTISEVVRQDLLKWYGAKWADRVHVVHNPVALERFEGGGEQQFTKGRPYIMCVALDRPQKNLFTLIRAFHLLKDRFPDHLLVMAGELRLQPHENREKVATLADTMPSTSDLVDQLGLEDRVLVTGFISDAELGALYRGASAFVLPSLFEGFGMPAVEALGLGVPTLVSGIPVLREITFDQAHYVDDLQSPHEFADRLAGILQNEQASRPPADLVDKVRCHFSPRNIARKYLDLLTG